MSKNGKNKQKNNRTNKIDSTKKVVQNKEYKGVDKKKTYRITTMAIMAIALVGIAGAYSIASNGSKGGTSDTGDIVIDTKNISDKATFISYNGTDNDMGVIAVKASDGTIRTAFNTCQVCYSSGRGYYELKGKNLQCQNCGNIFTGDQVALEHGGCNPVPISEDMRVESDGKILISKDTMEQASSLFATWK